MRPLTETRDMGQRRRAERARRRWSYGGESQSLTHTPRVMAGTCAHWPQPPRRSSEETIRGAVSSSLYTHSARSGWREGGCTSAPLAPYLLSSECLQWGSSKGEGQETAVILGGYLYLPRNLFFCFHMKYVVPLNFIAASIICGICWILRLTFKTKRHKNEKSIVQRF